MDQRPPPITIRLGKYDKRTLRKLERGEGKAFDRAQAALEQVRASLGAEAADKVLVPVVMIYKKKQKKSRAWLG